MGWGVVVYRVECDRRYNWSLMVGWRQQVGCEMGGGGIWNGKSAWVVERGRSRGGRLRHSHLGRQGSLALELRLVAVERLLSAVLEVVAGVMLRQTMLTQNRSPQSVTRTRRAAIGCASGSVCSPLHRTRLYSGGIGLQCGPRQSCTGSRPGTGNVSWQAWLDGGVGQSWDVITMVSKRTAGHGRYNLRGAGAGRGEV